jgi:hypothetical protein
MRSPAARDQIAHAEQEEFLTTNVVHRRGYERTHLNDDV